MNVKLWFPTSIYCTELKHTGAQRLNAELLRETYQIQDVDEAGQAWSTDHYRGGFTSYSSMDHLHLSSPNFAALKNQIDRHLRKFTRYLEMDFRGDKLAMTSCWVNIMPPNTFHTSHLHPLSVISGTYYLKTPRGSGALKFEDPRMSQLMNSPTKQDGCHERNQSFAKYAAKTGQVVLFESWLRHEVSVNLSTEDRVSVSFNYGWC